jgi:hypothetical protein
MPQLRGLNLRNLDTGRLDSGGKPVASNALRRLARLPDTAEEVRASRDAESGGSRRLSRPACKRTNVRTAKLSDRA